MSKPVKRDSLEWSPEVIDDNALQYLFKQVTGGKDAMTLEQFLHHCHCDNKEAEKALTVQFQSLDADGNGTLSFKEFKHILKPVLDEMTPEETNGGDKVQAGWDNHFSAFGAQDVKKILADYTEASEIKIYNWSTGVEDVYSGLKGIENFFTTLFKNMPDLSDLDAPVIEVREDMVLLVWKCPASGIDFATDTFIFDAATGKIMKQNIVCMVPSAPKQGPAPVPTKPTGGAVQKGWDNHFSAFGAQDVPKILLDYTESSEIIIYNKTEGTTTMHKGLSGVETVFKTLFADLYNTSGLAAPVVQVEEAPFGMVYLVWECPTSGYMKVTDSFMFDKDGKITRQNIVAITKPKKSWMEENWILILVIVLSLMVAVAAIVAANPEAMTWLKKEEAVIEEVVQKGRKAANKFKFGRKGRK